MSNDLKRKKKIKIWQRDNYICQYCGKIVIDNYPSEITYNSATVDHVKCTNIELDNSLDNLKTACYLCNSYLGDFIGTFEEKKQYLLNGDSIATFKDWHKEKRKRKFNKKKPIKT